MARAIVFVLCMIVASSLAENQNTNVNLAVVENLDEYLSQHPEVKLLQKLEKVIAPKSESPLLLITYRLGNRIAGKLQKSNRFELSIHTISIQISEFQFR